MNTVKIRDFLTAEQLTACCKLYPSRARIRDEVLKPNLAAINAKLGQENDPDYLSYAIVYVLERAQHRMAVS